MNDFKIVVVDDDPAIAGALCAILRSAGYPAFAAYEAESALMVCKHHLPALLISDIHMPGMNGVELAMQMGRVLPQCRVILFSGHIQSPALLDAAQKDGHDFEFLQKPIAPEDLLSRVAVAAKTWRQAQSLSA